VLLMSIFDTSYRKGGRWNVTISFFNNTLLTEYFLDYIPVVFPLYFHESALS
jgi:hypothetical protein